MGGHTFNAPDADDDYGGAVKQWKGKLKLLTRGELALRKKAAQRARGTAGIPGATADAANGVTDHNTSLVPPGPNRPHHRDHAPGRTLLRTDSRYSLTGRHCTPPGPSHREPRKADTPHTGGDDDADNPWAKDGTPAKPGVKSTNCKSVRFKNAPPPGEDESSGWRRYSPGRSKLGGGGGAGGGAGVGVFRTHSKDGIGAGRGRGRGRGRGGRGGGGARGQGRPKKVKGFGAAHGAIASRYGRLKQQHQHNPHAARHAPVAHTPRTTQFGRQ